MGSHSLPQGIVPAQGEIEVERTLQFIKNLLSFASTDSSFSLISHHLVPIPFADLPVQLPKCPASRLSEHLCDMPLAILVLLDPTSSLRLCLSITFSGRLSPSFFFSIILFTCLLAVLAIHCCVGFSPVAVSGGYFLLVVPGFSLRWPLLLLSALGQAGFSSCGARTQ